MAALARWVRAEVSGRTAGRRMVVGVDIVVVGGWKWELVLLGG